MLKKMRRMRRLQLSWPFTNRTCVFFAEVELPDEGRVFVVRDPDHGVLLDGLRFLELIGETLRHRHPTKMATDGSFLVLPYRSKAWKLVNLGIR